MKEIWKDIKGYEDLYQVSNFGRIKSLPKKRNGKFTEKEIILKLFKNTNGYIQTNLWKNNKGKNFLVHKLVAEAFISNNYNLAYTIQDYQYNYYVYFRLYDLFADNYWG